ncbi:MAG: hypothetical protein A2033_08165 [Bacteroidetes bacterium GWA2_31_9]|nr:MAG: hypothetical protein A2033_08165 [Bacteroidetes bacterium GWA2_31_9]
MEEKINFYFDILKEMSLSASVFEYYSNQSRNFISNNGKISYDYFVETDHRSNNEQKIHIFFSKDANALATADYLKEKQKKNQSIKVFIYITRAHNIQSKIKEKIKEIITPTNIDFIQDILKEISSKKLDSKFQRIFYDTSNAFIYPTIQNSDNLIDDKSNNELTDNIIDGWYKSEGNPILLIKGKAGIGKTTVAQHISNVILKNDQYASNIFINSVEAKKRLVKECVDYEINLYDLYKSSILNEKYLDNKFFKYNLDTGNFFLIIDGIDELITKVSNFNIINFLDSIISINQQFENPKIIVTCRSEFWDVTNEKIQSIKIYPFNLEQATNFFKKSFLNENRKIQKALEIANDFHKKRDIKKENQKDGKQKENLYHPYALDLITKIINDNVLTYDVQKTRMLKTNKTLDYIIAKMCFRENYLLGETRIINLSIDEQVKIFQYIAINYNGKIKISELDSAVYFGINKNLEKEQDFEPDVLTKSFSSHPLFNEKEINIEFAYDFLCDFFKATYVASYLDYEFIDEVNKDFIKIIKDCTFGSQLVRDVALRVESWSDAEILTINNLFDIVKKNDFPDKDKLFSGVFNLAYEVNKKFNYSLTNKIENTKFLNKIFTESKIENLHIININEPLIFDFTQVHEFDNCYFENYSSFWENDWSTVNYFKNCSFNKIGVKNNKKELPWSIDTYNNFDFNSQSHMDIEFKNQFKKTNEIDDEIRSEVKRLIDGFIRFFWYSNNLQAQNYEVRDSSCKLPFRSKFPKLSSLSLTLEDFIEIANNIEIVEWTTFMKSVVKINIAKEYRTEVSQYLLDQSFSPILKKFEDILYDKIR